MSRAATVSASNALKATNDFYMAALDEAYREIDQLQAGLKRAVAENEILRNQIPKDSDPQRKVEQNG